MAIPTRIDHIGIACHDLEATIDFYRTTFGLSLSHVEVNEQQGVREAVLPVNEADDGHTCYLQLLSPVRDDAPVAKFLAKHGEGVHHVALGTPDLAASVGRAAEHGLEALYEDGRAGTLGSIINFFHPKDCGGVLIELVESRDSSDGTRR